MHITQSAFATAAKSFTGSQKHTSVQNADNPENPSPEILPSPPKPEGVPAGIARPTHAPKNRLAKEILLLISEVTHS